MDGEACCSKLRRDRSRPARGSAGPSPGHGQLARPDGARTLSIQEAARAWQAGAQSIFGFQGAAGCEIEGPDCVALSKAYGGDGVRVEKAGELPAAIDAAVASPSGLFILHVLIDPLLKADMAAFIDKAAMNSG